MVVEERAQVCLNDAWLLDFAFQDFPLDYLTEEFPVTGRTSMNPMED
jgi:hypothetical protein